jgi:polyhydroxyalkanoate synthesis regulator phasin
VEIRCLRTTAAAELNRVRREHGSDPSLSTFSETIEILRNRRVIGQGHLHALQESVETLHVEIRDCEAELEGGTGEMNIRSAIERIIHDDTLLDSLAAPEEPELDALRRQIADVTVMSLRLKRDIDRLELPTGNAHLPPSALAQLSEESPVTGGWISTVESETILLNEELRDLHRERDALFRNVALCRARETTRPSREPTVQDIDRYIVELVELKNELGTTRNLKQLMSTFIKSSDEAFAILAGRRKKDGTPAGDMRREFERRLRAIVSSESVRHIG